MSQRAHASSALSDGSRHMASAAAVVLTLGSTLRTLSRALSGIKMGSSSAAAGPPPPPPPPPARGVAGVVTGVEGDAGSGAASPRAARRRAHAASTWLG